MEMKRILYFKTWVTEEWKRTIIMLTSRISLCWLFQNQNQKSFIRYTYREYIYQNNHTHSYKYHLFESMLVKRWNLRCTPTDYNGSLSIKQQGTPSSKPRKTVCYNDCVTLKFDSHLGSARLSEHKSSIFCHFTLIFHVYVCILCIRAFVSWMDIHSGVLCDCRVRFY